jgi:release factor glutamine methyltransferase
VTARAGHKAASCTPSRAIREGADYLARRGVDRPLPAAEILLAHVLRTDRAGVYARASPLRSDEATTFDVAVSSVGRGVPVQYVTGDQPFRELTLAVRPGVFIPRPETEVLVELALGLVEARARPVVVDVGTGSGAIALSIAHHRPDAVVVATDVAPAAAALARENSERLHVEIDVRTGDLLLPAADLRGHVDLVVSNPPYVEGDLGELPLNVRAEPPVALAGGMQLHRRLAAQASRALVPHGAIAVEVAPPQSRVLAGALEREFTAVRIETDLTGRDRFVVARRA